MILLCKGALQQLTPYAALCMVTCCTVLPASDTGGVKIPSTTDREVTCAQ